MTQRQSIILYSSYVVLGLILGCSQPDVVKVENYEPAAISSDKTIVRTAIQQPVDADSIQETENSKAEPEPDSSDKTKIDAKTDESQNPKSQDDEQELPSLSDAENNPIDPSKDSFRKKPDPVIEKQTIDIPKNWKRLSKEQEIWIDLKNKQVIAAGNICMRAGPLEVFACPRRTKEHESVVSVNALSSQIHAALLATGTEPGEPVRWNERYQAATGPVIKIDVMWKQDGKVKRIAAQKMVKDFKSDKEMTHDWVFGGSQTYTDEETGESYYYGDSGELVCLSNFSTATMDVPVESSDANNGLLFGANTVNIPEVNTKVYLIFMPQTETKKTTQPETKDK